MALAVLKAPRRRGGARTALTAVALAALVGAGGTVAVQADVALAATGTTWYVSASATSDPACSAASQSNPFQTIAAALACAQSGDTVSVGAGTFAGSFTIHTNVTL